LSCHTDHKGARGETTTETVAEYRAACVKCHAGYEKQKGAFQGILVWDHKDHTEKQGLRCEQCHDARPSERAHHGQTFITRPDCFNVDCHLKPLKKQKGWKLGAVRKEHAPWKDDCFACHTWLGKIDSGKCASCHDDGKGREFAPVGFAAHHAQRDLDCARCHTEHKGESGNTTIETQSDYEAHCIDCHAGYESRPHTIQGEVFLHAQHSPEARGIAAEMKEKLACSACHDVRRDAPEHGKVTLAEDACIACHMRRDHPQKQVLAQPWLAVSASHAPWEKDCARCHAASSDTRGSLCADCHRTPDGRATSFVGFAKHHLDPTLDCAACHQEHRGRTPPPTT
ncbi:MAG: cytochrome c3 family protein, partial [Polyangiaceae bacterium]